MDTAPEEARKPDRWAHRRAEPRFFAFVWTSYIFGATALTLLSLAGGVMSPDITRPAARSLLSLVAAGIVLIWPLVRLSQEWPRGAFSTDGVVSGLKDLFVVIVPTQAVIWPQWWMTGWPLPVVATVAAMLASWAVLVGGILAIAAAMSGPERPAARGRAVWMGAFVLLALAGPGAAFIAAAPADGAAGPRPSVLMMTSPIGAVHELTRDRPWTGRAAANSRDHTVWSVVPAAVSLPLWAAALLRERSGRGRRAYRGLH